MSPHVQNFPSVRRLEGWCHSRHHIPLSHTVPFQGRAQMTNQIFSAVYRVPLVIGAPFWSGVFIRVRLGTPLLGMLFIRKQMLDGGPEVCLVLRLHSYSPAFQTLGGSWWKEGQTGRTNLSSSHWTPAHNCTFFPLRSTAPCRSYTAHKLTKSWPSTTKRSRLMKKSWRRRWRRRGKSAG